MGLKDFRIVFDNPWGTYYPGQNVSGRVIVGIDSPKNVRGIKIRIKGEAHTCWSTDRQELNAEGRYENESQTVTGHEEYFNIQYHLVGSASGDQIELPIGENIYPFTCTLPPSLPSSFEHDYGHIRYTVKATIDRPWKFDHEVKSAFTVVSMLDLNNEARAIEPVNLNMEKTFCCLCCGSPPLRMEISLPAKGYVPGQSIPIKVHIDNQSGIVVDTVKLILRKIVTFRVTTPRSDVKCEKIVIAEVSKGPVEANQSVDYDQKLDIPPVPPSNLTNCGIIDLEYNLKVEACVAGWYRRNLHQSILLFIGTVPLANYQTAISPPSADKMIGFGEHANADPTYGGYPSGYPAYNPSNQVTPSAPQAPPDSDLPAQIQPNSNLYPNLPPPTYEEAGWSVRSLREPGESDHVMGIKSHFAPRYPVYNFTS